MILFCILIQSLLHKCFAEVYVTTGRLGELMDLSDVVRCDSWKYEDSEVAMPLNVTSNSEGSYKCSTGDHVVLFLVYEVIEFSVTPEKGLTTDENITMVCSLSTPFKSLNVNNTITIFDPSGSVLSADKGEEEVPELGRLYTISLLTFIPEKSGKLTYKCLWNHYVEYEGVLYNGTMQKNLPLRIFVTVRGARPDKYTVMVNENVTCSADGDPIPHEFHWRCDRFDEDKDGWKATDEVIVFTHAKEYSCRCVASHLIHIKVYHAVWNGTIVVNPSNTETSGGKTDGGKSDGGKSPGGKPPTKGGGGNVPGGKKDKGKTITNANAKNDDEDEEYEEGETESEPKDQKRPSGSGANSIRAVVALALLMPCFVAMATK